MNLICLHIRVKCLCQCHNFLDSDIFIGGGEHMLKGNFNLIIPHIIDKLHQTNSS